MLSVLYTLLLVTSLFCSSIAMFGPGGIFVFALAGLLPLLLYSFRSFSRAILCYALILLFVALLLPCISCAREAARCCQCRNNLKQLSLALLNYEQHYKCFPPTSIADENGKPIHSWRVLILPFIEGDSCYKQYDFNEPWDGPNNKKLFSNRPQGFACASDINADWKDESLTSYVAVVAPNTIWTNKDSTHYSGKSVMLAEVVGSDIRWTEPKDYVLSSSHNHDPKAPRPSISSKHEIDNGLFFREMPAAHVAFADGNVRLLPTALVTEDNLLHAGVDLYGNSVDRWILDNRLIHWPHCIGFAVWLVSLVLLVHWSVRCRRTGVKRIAEVAVGRTDNSGVGEG